MSGPLYEFDEDFQSKIVALVIRDSVFNQRTLGLVDPKFFTSTVDATLVNVCLNYFKTYKRCPSLPIIGKLVKALFDKKVLREELRADTKERLGALLREDIGDRDYIIEEVATFAKHQALEAAIIDSVGFLKAHEFDKIAEHVKKALLVGKSEDIGEYDYFKELANRTKERRERIAGILPPTGVSTGLPALDDLLMHKGWGIGELTVLMGGAKAGKTMALIDFAKNASYDGKNVLYVTLEVASRIVAERLDANLADTIIKELEKKFIDVQDKIDAISHRFGKLIVREFSAGSFRPSDLRRLLAYYVAKGVKFDMVVLDYADIMAPDFRTTDAIENSKSIYVDLRSIAREEEFALLTATQTNRDGFKAATARAEHVSEDFNKVRIADLLISINHTDEERAMGEARLYFAASRNQEGSFTVRIKQNLQKAKFIERVMGKE